MSRQKQKNSPRVVSVYSQPMERRITKKHKRQCLHVWYVVLQFNPRARAVRLRISAVAAKWLMRVQRLV